MILSGEDRAPRTSSTFALFVGGIELLEQPGEGPVAVGGAAGHPQGLGGPAERQSDGDAELDRRGRVMIDIRQPDRRIVPVDQVVGRRLVMEEFIQVEVIGPSLTGSPGKG